MFQLDFAKHTARKDGEREARMPSAVQAASVEAVSLLFWEEHCLECAQPECYKSCSLYSRRADTNCARFYHGICPNRSYEGLLKYGADIHFKRWGKLQTTFGAGAASVATIRRVAALDECILRFVTLPILNRGPFRNVRPMMLHYYYNYLRRKLLRRALADRRFSTYKPDEFVVEAWNPMEGACTLIIEIFQFGELRFRTALRFESGHNLFRIPYSQLALRAITAKQGSARVVVYPEKDAESRIVFTWLHFVRYRRMGRVGHKRDADKQRGRIQHILPAEKVKCLVWDLDNTFWKGVLTEDGANGIVPRQEAIALVKDLDRRGIVQSIASKNEYVQAWSVLEGIGLDEYFLYPAINWGPKSESIRQIAKELNVNVDALALIDDSEFERREVLSVFPQARVFNATEIATLLELPEFDVSVTEESKRRRKSYMVEAQRRKIAATFGEDYDQFLTSCRIRACVFTPQGDSQLRRCVELLQRTNQLNMSGRRYDHAGFLELVQSPKIASIAISSGDRFGEYGLVGFASIAFANGEATLQDFAMSCRVAQKGLENGVLKFLLDRVEGMGYLRLLATFVPTERNKLLLSVFREVGFAECEGRQATMSIDVTHQVPRASVVTIIDEGIESLPLRVKK